MATVVRAAKAVATVAPRREGGDRAARRRPRARVRPGVPAQRRRINPPRNGEAAARPPCWEHGGTAADHPGLDPGWWRGQPLKKTKKAPAHPGAFSLSATGEPLSPFDKPCLEIRLLASVPAIPITGQDDQRGGRLIEYRVGEGQRLLPFPFLALPGRDVAMSPPRDRPTIARRIAAASRSTPRRAASALNVNDQRRPPPPWDGPSLVGHATAGAGATLVARH